MKIHYVSGSRADFGLMVRSLQTLAADDRLDLSIVLTGQALIARYGDVAREVASAGLRVAATVPVELTGSDGLEMALAFATEERDLARFWASRRPDMVLLLGDRGEMLAAAIAAFHLQIRIAHLHGGERSGTLDEGFRHAISKLATWHLPATQEAAARLIRMGERPETIMPIGAPGLVELAGFAAPAGDWLIDRFGTAADKPTALVLFHPVVDEIADGADQIAVILAAVQDAGLTAIILRPNSDSGGQAIDQHLSAWRGDGVVIDHLERSEFLNALAASDVLIGNSSAGIIESASLGTPCVNIGSRQDGRERNGNVVDCPIVDQQAIGEALTMALAMAGPFSNCYGDGLADGRLRDVLLSLPVGGIAPKKRNAY